MHVVVYERRADVGKADGRAPHFGGEHHRRAGRTQPPATVTSLTAAARANIRRHAFMAETDSSITPIPKSEDARKRVPAESRQTADHAPTTLFTGTPVPIDELMKRQGIGGPQGLAAIADPEWELDVESERFLEAIFAESD